MKACKHCSHLLSYNSSNKYCEKHFEVHQNQVWEANKEVSLLALSCPDFIIKSELALEGAKIVREEKL